MLPGTKQVRIPDRLWLDPDLPDGAKLLWCYFLTASFSGRECTYRDVRQALGTSQKTLLRYIRALEEKGWLQTRVSDLRRIVCQAMAENERPALSLPMDLITDQRVAFSARIVWGIIRRYEERCSYGLLREVTGYSQPSLSKYVAQLRQTGWLVGSIRRENRTTVLSLRTVNPHAIKREAELAELNRALALARNQEGYSLGQCLLARMVRVLVAETTIVENAEVMGVVNPETGGRLQLDLYLPEYKVALEFQGPQHDRPTELHADLDAYMEQRKRDLMKRATCLELDIHLILVRPEDLSFQRLSEWLAPLVPLEQDLHPKWHLYQRLDQAAVHYRRKAARSAG